MEADGRAREAQLARVLVGRDQELAWLRDAWSAGRGVALVRGPAGVGKSRLVRELTSWARAQGGVVLTGRCSPTSGEIPLRALREALLGAARAGVQPPDELAPFVPALARVVPEWGTATLQATDTSALVLGEGMLRLLSTLAPEGTTTTLVIDDLQWADHETVAVGEYLADNVRDHRVLVVGMVRDGEPGPGTDLAEALVARRVATALELRPVSDDEVLQIARSCLGGDQIPTEVARTLVQRSEGVPFLVEELLAAAATGGWEAVGAAVPGSIAASVDVRLGALAKPARELLCHAAVLGRQFEWNVAARAAGVPEDEAPELLRQAARAQLVDVEGAAFRFRHALTRDAVLASAGPAERAVAAMRTLRALEELDPVLEGEHCQIAASLAEEAGRPERAAALLLQAARRARAEGSLASAEALATRARAVAGSTSGNDIDELLLEVWALAGQTDRATEVGARLLSACADPLARADVHLVLGRVAIATGRWDTADEHADAARVSAAADASRLARTDALAAQAAIGRGDISSALPRASRALDGARATSQPEVQCEALEVIGRAQRGRDVAAAESAFIEAHAVATSAGLGVWRARALQELGTVDMYETLSTTRLDEARRAAVEVGALSTVAVVDLQLAAVHDERGDLDLALAAARRSEEASRRWGLSTLPMSLSIQAAAHARAGRRDDMRAAADAALATGEDRANVESSLGSNAFAVLHLAHGDLSAAAQACDRAMDVLRAYPDAMVPFPGLWALLRTVLDDRGDEARAEVRALPSDTPVSRIMLVAADAVAQGRAGDREGARTTFARADDALARHQGGFRRALVRLLVAPRAVADDWGEPVEWLRESLATFEQKGLAVFAGRCRIALRDAGAPVPRRGRGDRQSVPSVLAALGITSREVDVLALVADGRSNKEVSQELAISPRTVDKHVERLLMKTRTTRAGLCDVARDAGLLRT